MMLTPRKLNAFTIFKLPASYFCGVRTKYIDDSKCVVTVKHKWINQTPTVRILSRAVYLYWNTRIKKQEQCNRHGKDVHGR